MEQTAVEWLLDQIQQKLYIRDNVIEQAKEMFEKQLREAWEDGRSKGWKSGCGDSETYYDQTFNK
jgi:hypothetical protein